jgi:hypothetical protein
VALEVVERVRTREPFELEIIDIDTDPKWVALYGEEVPVVLVDGRKHAKYHIDEEAFVRRLRS